VSLWLDTIGLLIAVVCLGWTLAVDVTRLFVAVKSPPVAVQLGSLCALIWGSICFVVYMVLDVK
jgi:hypothetical protein